MNPEGSISKGSQDTFEDIVTRTSGDTVEFKTNIVSTPEPPAKSATSETAPSKPLKESNPVPAGSETSGSDPTPTSEQKLGIKAAATERTTSLDLYKPGGRLSRFNADGTLKTR